MSAPRAKMRRRASFFGEIGFGLIISLVTAALGLTLALLLPADLVARAVVTALGLAFVLRALARSGESTGRITVAVVWALATVAAWIFDPGLAGFVALHAGMIWLVRSLYTYSRITEAALDLGLTALAVSFAVWALVRTDSVFLAVWCFALIQAMHIALPAITDRLLQRGERETEHDDPNRGFADALNAADEALQRLAARR